MDEIDYSSLSDEELQKLANQLNISNSASNGQKTPDEVDYSSLSDEELQRLSDSFDRDEKVSEESKPNSEYGLSERLDDQTVAEGGRDHYAGQSLVEATAFERQMRQGRERNEDAAAMGLATGKTQQDILDRHNEYNWEDGDGGPAIMPEGETNEWGGNLRNEGRKPLFRRDDNGKVTGYSTTSSTYVKDEDGKYAVIPTVVDGKELSEEKAIEHYRETGEHWGKANDEESAMKMAGAVHDKHMADNQKSWNDYLHRNWNDVSDEITGDEGMKREHARRQEEQNQQPSTAMMAAQRTVQNLGNDPILNWVKKGYRLAKDVFSSPSAMTELERAAYDSGIDQQEIDQAIGESNGNPIAFAKALQEMTNSKLQYQDEQRTKAQARMQANEESFGSKVVTGTLGMAPIIQQFMIANGAGASLGIVKNAAPGANWVTRLVTAAKNAGKWTIPTMGTAMSAERVSNLMADEYSYDPNAGDEYKFVGEKDGLNLYDNGDGSEFADDGGKILIKKGDTAWRAALKGVPGGFGEAAIFSLPIGEAAMGWVPKSVMTGVAKHFAPKTVETVAKCFDNYRKFGQFSGLRGQPTMLMLMDMNMIKDEVLGLNVKDADFDGVGKAWEEVTNTDPEKGPIGALTAKGQMDMFVSVLGLVALHGAGALTKARMDIANNRRGTDQVLKTFFDMPQEALDKMDPKVKDFVRRVLMARKVVNKETGGLGPLGSKYVMTPERAENFCKLIGKKYGEATTDTLRQMMEYALKSDGTRNWSKGIDPNKAVMVPQFKPRMTVNVDTGKRAIDWGEVDDLPLTLGDGTEITIPCQSLVDESTGTKITKFLQVDAGMGDDGYIYLVTDKNGNRATRKGMKDAIIARGEMYRAQKLREEMRGNKLKTLQDLYARRLPGETPDVYTNLADYERRNGKPFGGEGDVAGYNPETDKMTIFLDAIETPEQMIDVINHEVGRHKGIRVALEVRDEYGNVDEAATEKNIQQFFTQLSKKDPNYANQLAWMSNLYNITPEQVLANPRLAEETFAHSFDGQGMPAEPTMMQKTADNIRRMMRGFISSLPYSRTEQEAMLRGAMERMSQETGGMVNYVPEQVEAEKVRREMTPREEHEARMQRKEEGKAAYELEQDLKKQQGGLPANTDIDRQIRIENARMDAKENEQQWHAAKMQSEDPVAWNECLRQANGDIAKAEELFRENIQFNRNEVQNAKNEERRVARGLRDLAESARVKREAAEAAKKAEEEEGERNAQAEEQRGRNMAENAEKNANEQAHAERERKLNEDWDAAEEDAGARQLEAEESYPEPNVEVLNGRSEEEVSKRQREAAQKRLAEKARAEAELNKDADDLERDLMNQHGLIRRDVSTQLDKAVNDIDTKEGQRIRAERKAGMAEYEKQEAERKAREMAEQNAVEPKDDIPATNAEGERTQGERPARFNGHAFKIRYTLDENGNVNGWEAVSTEGNDVNSVIAKTDKAKKDFDSALKAMNPQLREYFGDEKSGDGFTGIDRGRLDGELPKVEETKKEEVKPTAKSTTENKEVKQEPETTESSSKTMFNGRGGDYIDAIDNADKAFAEAKKKRLQREQDEKTLDELDDILGDLSDGEDEGPAPAAPVGPEPTKPVNPATSPSASGREGTNGKLFPKAESHKANEKRVAKAVDGFVSKDKTRANLMLPCHTEDGMVVASDGRMLIATTRGWDKSKVGQNPNFPSWKQIVPSDSALVAKATINPKELANACKEALKISKATGNDNGVWTLIKFDNGEHSYVDADMMRKIAEVMDAENGTEIKTEGAERPIVFRNGNTDAIVMPSRTDGHLIPGLVISAHSGKIVNDPTKDGRVYVENSKQWLESLKKDLTRNDLSPDLRIKKEKEIAKLEKRQAAYDRIDQLELPMKMRNNLLGRGDELYFNTKEEAGKFVDKITGKWPDDSKKYPFDAFVKYLAHKQPDAIKKLGEEIVDKWNSTIGTRPGFAKATKEEYNNILKGIGGFDEIGTGPVGGPDGRGGEPGNGGQPGDGLPGGSVPPDGTKGAGGGIVGGTGSGSNPNGQPAGVHGGNEGTDGRPVGGSGSGRTGKPSEGSVPGNGGSPAVKNYEAKNLHIPGLKKSESILVEPRGLRGTDAPDIPEKYNPNIDKKFYESGDIQEHQVQPIAQSKMIHDSFLDNGSRRGILLGHRMGAGKTRMVAGIMLDNWNDGRKQSLWFSVNKKLKDDIYSELTPFGLENELYDVGSGKPNRNGIGFATYRDIIKDGFVDDLAKELGPDFDGVIAFDECHKAKTRPTVDENGVLQPDEDGKTKGKTQYYVNRLQELLPKARVVYLSATSATEVSDLGYARRLGIWGEKDSPFKDFKEFQNNIEGKNLAGMEEVARTLKRRGQYLSCGLSTEGVEFKRVKVETPEKVKSDYIRYNNAVRDVFDGIYSSLLNLDNLDWDVPKGIIHGMQQRMHNSMMSAVKLPAIIEMAKKDLAEGRTPVFSLVYTNEAGTERAVKTKLANGEKVEMDEANFGPKQILREFLDQKKIKKQFGIEYEDYDFPTMKFPEPTVGPGGEKIQGTPTKDPTSEKMRLKLLKKVDALPDDFGNPINMILDAFGKDNVANLTGINKKNFGADYDEFKAGGKKVLVFSKKANTGYSFHTNPAYANKDSRRVMYVLQPGWRADDFDQTIGRVHRNGQMSAPIIVLPETDIPGEARFVSSVARRHGQMSSFTQGDRRQGADLISEDDNYEDGYMKDAILATIAQKLSIDRGEVDDLAMQMNYMVINKNGLPVNKLLTIDKKTNKLIPADIAPGQFFNRLMLLDPEEQSAMFDKLINTRRQLIQNDKDDGKFDPGLQETGSVRDEDLGSVSLAKDMQIRHIDSVYKSNKVTFDDLNKRFHKVGPEGQDVKLKDLVYVRNKRTGRVFAYYTDGTKKRGEQGQVGAVSRLSVDGGKERMYQSTLENRRVYELLDEKDAREAWNREYENTKDERHGDEIYANGDMLRHWNDVIGAKLPRTYFLRPNGDKGEFTGALLDYSDIKRIGEKFGPEKGKKIADMVKNSMIRKLENGESLDMVDGHNASIIDHGHVKELVIRGFKNPAEARDYAGKLSKQMESDGSSYRAYADQKRVFIPNESKTIRAFIENNPVNLYDKNDTKVGNTGDLYFNKNEERKTDDVRLEQKHTSAGTSLAKNEPTLFKDGEYSPIGKPGVKSPLYKYLNNGEEVLDIGAGKTRYAEDVLSKHGVGYSALDPFNRDSKNNANVIKGIENGKRYPVVTAANLLNVLDTPELRSNVILQAAKAVKPNGHVLFDCYKAPTAGERGKGGDNFQTAMKPKDYVPEIKKWFNLVSVDKNGIITASMPKKEVATAKAEWKADADGERTYFFNKSEERRDEDKRFSPLLKKYGETKDFGDALLITPDGRMVSSANGKFGHNDLGGVDLKVDIDKYLDANPEKTGQYDEALARAGDEVRAELKRRGEQTTMTRVGYASDRMAQSEVIEGHKMTAAEALDSKSTDSVRSLLDDGAIRVDSNNGGIELSRKPNEAQESSIYDFVDWQFDNSPYDNYSIDLHKGDKDASVSYSKRTSPRKVIEDIREFYDSGTVPKGTGNGLSTFYFNIDEEAGRRIHAKGKEDADKMLAEGKDRREIWKKTGWWKGKDEKWRYEIPGITEDESKKVMDFVRNSGKFYDHDTKSTSIDSYAFTLGDLESEMKQAGEKLPNSLKTLIAAYPRIAHQRIVLDYKHPKTLDEIATLGYSSGKEIRLYKGGMGADTFNHEVQHKIQEYSGMGRGTNPASAGGFDRYQQEHGEWEARLASARAAMTDEQRKNEAPWETKEYAGIKESDTKISDYNKARIRPDGVAEPEPPVPSAVNEKRSRWNSYMENFQDRYHALLEGERKVDKRSTKEIYRKDSPYNAMRLLSGHQEAARMRYENIWKRPLEKMLKDAGVTSDDVGMYMMAKDVPARNAKVMARNGVLDGSGMTEEMAKDFIADMESRFGTEKMNAVKAIADHLWKMQREGLERRLQSGRISKEMFDKWVKEEPFHVPMRTDYTEESDGVAYSTKQWRQNDFKTAEGRKSIAGSPVEFMLKEYQEAMYGSNENDARKVLAKYISAHPELGSVKRGTKKTKGWSFTHGQLEDVVDPYYHEQRVNGGDGRPNLVAFKDAGDLMMIDMTGELGNRIAAAVTGRDVKRAWGWYNGIMRPYAATATELSPTFAGRNFLADMIETSLNTMGDKGLVKGGAATVKNIVNAIRMQGTINAYNRTGEFKGKYADVMRKYVESGASIGGAANEGFSEIKEEMKKVGKGGKVVDALKLAGRILSLYNKQFEMANRLAVFKDCIDSGYSEGESAMRSREYSTDFNKYGNQRWMNSVWMFSGSVIGSAVRQVESIAHSKHGIQLLTGLFAYGMIESLIEHYWNASDDEESRKKGMPSGDTMTDYNRANSLYFRNGDRFFRVPFHAGPFSVIKFAGNKMMRAILGDEKASKAMTSAIKEVGDTMVHFTGFGDAGPDVLQTILPTLAVPFAQGKLNVDFAGRPIERKMYSDTKPYSENGRAKTGAGFKAVAKWLNEISGGSKTSRGSLDYSPEMIEHTWNSLGKNTARDIVKIYDTINDLSNGTIDIDHLPFASDVNREIRDNTQNYYEADRLFRKMKDDAARRRISPGVVKSLNKLQQEIIELRHWEAGDKMVNRRWVNKGKKVPDRLAKRWMEMRLKKQQRMIDYMKRFQ